MWRQVQPIPVRQPKKPTDVRFVREGYGAKLPGRGLLFDKPRRTICLDLNIAIERKHHASAGCSLNFHVQADQSDGGEHNFRNNL